MITLFHKPSLPASVRALTLLKQARATAVATATEDQASSHTTQSKAQRTEFELDVQEAAPTSDQVRSILEFLGASKAGEVVEGAKDENDAVKMVDKLRYPIVGAYPDALGLRQLITTAGCGLEQGQSR